MTKAELIKKIEDAGRKFGKYEDVVIVESAYNTCSDSTWAATAYRVRDNDINVVKVYWDFSDVENYKECDDASSLPWDDESIMSVDSNENRVEYFDLTDEDDINRASRGIER